MKKYILLLIIAFTTPYLESEAQDTIVTTTMITHHSSQIPMQYTPEEAQKMIDELVAENNNLKSRIVEISIHKMDTILLNVNHIDTTRIERIYDNFTDQEYPITVINYPKVLETVVRGNKKINREIICAQIIVRSRSEEELGNYHFEIHTKNSDYDNAHHNFPRDNNNRKIITK